jgi:hypothetical protein
MLYFQNRLLYNMCIPQKEGFKVSIKNDDIQNILKDLFDEGYCADTELVNSHVDNLYNSIAAVLDQTTDITQIDRTDNRITRLITAIKDDIDNSDTIDYRHRLNGYPATLKDAPRTNEAMNELNTAQISPDNIKHLVNDILELRSDCLNSPNKTLHVIRSLVSEMIRIYIDIWI